MHRTSSPAPANRTDICAPWRTEYTSSRVTANGHEVPQPRRHDDLGDIRRSVADWKAAHRINLLEGFDDVKIFD